MAVNSKINRRGTTGKRVVTGPGQFLGPKSGNTRSDLRTLGGTLFPVDVYEVNDAGAGSQAAAYTVNIRPYAEGAGRASVRSIGDMAIFKQVDGIATPTNAITCLARKKPSTTGGAVSFGPYVLAAGDRLWALVSRKDASTVKYQIELVFDQITIDTPPANDTKATGAAKTFTVVASTNDGGTLSYQWQLSTNGGTSYSDITNAGVYSGATTDSLVISDVTGLNARKYRVVVGSDGAAPDVTSAAATLTVT